MENRLSLRVNVIGRKGRVIELQIYFTSTIGRDISQFIYGTATLVRPKKYRDPVSRLVYTRTSNRETRCTSPFADVQSPVGLFQTESYRLFTTIFAFRFQRLKLPKKEFEKLT